MLDAIFERALDAILLADDAGRYIRVNPAAETLTGYTSEELGEMTIFDLTPTPTKDQGLSMWRDFIGQGTLSGEYTMTRKDGSTVEVEFQAVASIRPGLHLSIVRDVTTRKRAERQLRRAANLQEATAAMSAAVETTRVAEVVLSAGLSALDAQAGLVAMIVGDGRWDEQVVTAGAEVFHGRRRFALEGPPMLHEVFERGGPIRLERVADLPIGWARSSFAELGDALVCLPLVASGTLVGGLYFFWTDKGCLYEDEPAFAATLADLCAQALDRARLFTAARQARERAVASERSVLEYQKRLQEMAFERAVVEERERRRVTEALHDGVAQYLALAKITLDPVAQRLQGDDREAIAAVTRLIKRAIDQTRSLSFELSPPLLYDLGIKAALSWLAEKLEQDTGLRVEMDDDGIEPTLDEVTASTVYRTVRELLLNAAKHAKSATATVSMRQHLDDFEIIVADQGVGFDPCQTSARPGFGLMSVREQIGRLGGVVELLAAPDQGVRIAVRVPHAGVR